MYMVHMKSNEMILVMLIIIQFMHIYSIDFPMFTHEQESQLKQICLQKLQIRTMSIFFKLRIIRNLLHKEPLMLTYIKK